LSPKRIDSIVAVRGNLVRHSGYPVAVWVRKVFWQEAVVRRSPHHGLGRVRPSMSRAQHGQHGGVAFFKGKETPQLSVIQAR
jgi:hypothetical protein